MNLSHSAFAYLHESLILENSLCFTKVQYRIQLLIYIYVIYIGEIHKNGFRIEAGWNNFIYKLTLYHINTIQNGQLLNIMSYVPSFYIPFHSYFHIPFWQCELNLLIIFWQEFFQHSTVHFITHGHQLNQYLLCETLKGSFYSIK